VAFQPRANARISAWPHSECGSGRCILVRKRLIQRFGCVRAHRIAGTADLVKSIQGNTLDTPRGYRNWNKLVLRENIQIKVSNNLIVLP
jgi:hypothetical protein